MSRLICLISLAYFGCATEPEGYYEKGIYIPTEVSACVNFCRERGRVYRMVWNDELLEKELIQCECGDGSVELFPIDPYSILLEK